MNQDQVLVVEEKILPRQIQKLRKLNAQEFHLLLLPKIKVQLFILIVLLMSQLKLLLTKDLQDLPLMIIYLI